MQLAVVVTGVSEQTENSSFFFGIMLRDVLQAEGRGRNDPDERGDHDGTFRVRKGQPGQLRIRAPGFLLLCGCRPVLGVFRAGYPAGAGMEQRVSGVDGAYGDGDRGVGAVWFQTSPLLDHGTSQTATRKTTVFSRPGPSS